MPASLLSHLFLSFVVVVVCCSGCLVCVCVCFLLITEVTPSEALLNVTRSNWLQQPLCSSTFDWSTHITLWLQCLFPHLSLLDQGKEQLSLSNVQQNYLKALCDKIQPLPSPFSMSSWLLLSCIYNRCIFMYYEYVCNFRNQFNEWIGV